MGQQQAGKGLNMSHQSFLSNHFQIPRNTLSPDDFLSVSAAGDNAQLIDSAAGAVNMSASYF